MTSATVVLAPAKAPGGFLHPYVQLGIGGILVTASELLLKKGAMAAPAAGWLTSIGVAALTAWWTWAGILSYLLSFASWLHVLRFVPLGIAFAAINAVHVLVPLGCLIFLDEPVSAKRWLGIALVLAGLLLMLRQVVKTEEKL